MGEERPDSHDTISVDGAGLPPRDCQENNDKNNIIIPSSLLPPYLARLRRTQRTAIDLVPVTLLMAGITSKKRRAIRLAGCWFSYQAGPWYLPGWTCLASKRHKSVVRLLYRQAGQASWGEIYRQSHLRPSSLPAPSLSLSSPPPMGQRWPVSTPPDWSQVTNMSRWTNI